MNGPDHKTSLNYKNFHKMVKKIRQIEILLGKKIKLLKGKIGIIFGKSVLLFINLL